MEQKTKRRIHLDFHTSPLIMDVGIEFDPDEFVETLIRAKVNSIVICAKCHHGMSYYSTEIGTVHPHMHRQDLLAEMVKACKSAGIETYAYYSVAWDNEIASKHPEWIQLDEHGDRRESEGLAWWKALCFNSPYVESVVLPQIKELVLNYDIDGIWLDIVIFNSDGYCCCPACVEDRRVLAIPDDRVIWQEYSTGVLKDFLCRVKTLIMSLNPEVRLLANNLVRIGCESFTAIVDEVDIEALPWGWGYLYYPLYSRYIRKHSMTYLGLTARFHGSWGEVGTLKSYPQLLFETARMLANGGGCSIGDQLHPRGKLNGEVYKRIGEVFGYIQERERWLAGATCVADIGVLAGREEAMVGSGTPSESLLGAVKLLTENHAQFDILDEKGDLCPYELLVVLPEVCGNQSLWTKIDDYLDAGGKLLLVSDALLGARGFGLRNVSVEYVGHSPYAMCYAQSTSPDTMGIPGTMPYAFHARAIETRPVSESIILAKIVYPYFERTREHFSSHAQIPPDRDSGYPFAVLAGNVIYLAADVFKSSYCTGDPVGRRMIGACLELLNPEPPIRTDASPSVEVTVTNLENETVIHLVDYNSEIGGKGVETMTVMPETHDITVWLKSSMTPASVYEAPQRNPLQYSFENGYVKVYLPILRVYGIIVVCWQPGESTK